MSVNSLVYCYTVNVYMCVYVGCILSTLLLKQSLDPVKHHDDIVKYCSMLVEVDPYRRGYYIDLCKPNVLLLCVYNVTC